jgi:hypothetical protein
LLLENNALAPQLDQEEEEAPMKLKRFQPSVGCMNGDTVTNETSDHDPNVKEQRKQSTLCRKSSHLSINTS